MIDKNNTVDVYVDGSCIGNPGPGGWSAIILSHDEDEEETVIAGGEKNTTNNRMELLAAIHGIERVDASHPIRMFTDSQYVSRGIQKWLARWRRSGWKTANRQKVKNKDLWEHLDALCCAKDVTWHWIRSHSGIIYNEKADKIAKHQASLRAGDST